MVKLDFRNYWWLMNLKLSNKNSSEQKPCLRYVKAFVNILIFMHAAVPMLWILSSGSCLKFWSESKVSWIKADCIMKNYFQVLVICALARNAKLERFLPIVYWHSAGRMATLKSFPLWNIFLRRRIMLRWRVRIVLNFHQIPFGRRNLYQVNKDGPRPRERCVEKFDDASIQTGTKTISAINFFKFRFKIKRACNTIQSDPNLANGFNAIGLSQGGLLL